MYTKPALTRFGTIRELTLAGWNGVDDGWFQRIDGNLTCSFTGAHCS